MNKCEMFVCRYHSTCIVGDSCMNGKYPKCKHSFCSVCIRMKYCTQRGIKYPYREIKCQRHV